MVAKEIIVVVVCVVKKGVNDEIFLVDELIYKKNLEEKMFLFFFT